MWKKIALTTLILFLITIISGYIYFYTPTHTGYDKALQTAKDINKNIVDKELSKTGEAEYSKMVFETYNCPKNRADGFLDEEGSGNQAQGYNYYSYDTLDDAEDAFRDFEKVVSKKGFKTENDNYKIYIKNVKFINQRDDVDFKLSINQSNDKYVISASVYMDLCYADN